MGKRGLEIMKVIKKIFIWIMVITISVCFYGENSEAAIYTYKKYEGIVYSEDFGDGIVVTNYVGNKKKLSIPSEINGKTVIQVIKLKGAEKLKEIHIPATVEYIRISQAPTLKKVTISKENKKYKVKNNIVLNKKGTVVHSAVGTLKNVKIPNTVTKIYHLAFLGARAKTVTFGKKVKTVDTYAFENCKKLKTVTMNDGIKKIGSRAFSGCKKLSKIVINNTKKAPSIKDFAFYRTKKGIKFYVKNETVAKQLKNNLWNTGVVDAKIYVGDELVYDKLTYKAKVY